MADVLIVPKKGLVVRNPITKHPLPADGALVSLSGAGSKYWRRRLACGDVTVGKPGTMVRVKTKKEKEG